jgi:phenylacetate-CoA ligase
MTEVGPVTYECPDHPGVLHVIESSYVAEIIDPVTGQHVESGIEGELVLTPLGRIGMPLLRYRTGDIVKAARYTICDCGRHDLALEGGILGRTDDMVIVRGVNIHPSAVEEVIRSVPGVTEYRVKVGGPAALTELAVEVEFDPAMNSTDERVKGLEAAFQRAFSLRVPVAVAACGTLPRGEVKSKRWFTA